MKKKYSECSTHTKGITMPKKINVRAVYKNGSLTPLVPLDLPEGEVVTLAVEVDSQLSKDDPSKKSTATDGAWTQQQGIEEIRRALHAPRLSTNEWLEMVRKRRDASQTRITAAEILEMRDADRK